MRDKAFTSFEQSLKRTELSMTPMIDMVFILLIFFVVTTTFTKETGIKVDKAKATTSQIINKNLFLIAIDVSGNYWYDKQRRSLEEAVALAAEAHESSDETKIVLIPDKEGRVEPLITIMDRLRSRNITRYSLGTRMSE